ncbi:MAG: glycosyltransferase family 39 protein [Acidobacteria bacterium]|nr:MAG: glycosyltransferase family 39 protein [Acidobacteriota bacterium]REK09168.1 MAG: glycosyltransferase family 39 protein [Acidobacteriota bacterium]
MDLSSSLRSPIQARWVVLLAAVLFAWNVWAYDVWAPDEPFFAEGAREMIDDGHWLVPHINGQVNDHKPPLFFWLIALPSATIGEVTSTTARLPSILAGLGTLFLVMRLAQRSGSAPAAGLAGLMMVTSHMFWEKSRSAQIDATLCFFVTLALYAFAGFRDGRWSGLRAGLVFWSACALGTLAKGPVAVIIPVGVALAVSLWDRRPGLLPRMGAVAGLAGFLVLTLSWAVAATLADNGYSAFDALRVHFVDRASGGMHHVRPFWYYGKVLPYALLPWSPLLPGAVWFAWRRRRNPEDRLLLVWAVFVVLMFSVSTEKRDLYILPAFPAFFLMIGRLAASILEWWRDDDADSFRLGRRWLTVPIAISATLLAVAAVAAPLVARAEAPEVTPHSFVLAAGLLGAALLIWWSLRRGLAVRAISRLAGAMAILLLIAVTFVYPRLNPSKSGRELADVVAEQVRQHAAPDALFGIEIGYLHRPINFYPPGLYLDFVGPAEFANRAEALFAAGRSAVLVIKQDRIGDIPVPVLRQATTVYETRLSRRDVAVLRFDPPPQPQATPMPPAPAEEDPAAAAGTPGGGGA